MMPLANFDISATLPVATSLYVPCCFSQLQYLSCHVVITTPAFFSCVASSNFGISTTLPLATPDTLPLVTSASLLPRCLSILLTHNWVNSLTPKHSFPLGLSFFFPLK